MAELTGPITAVLRRWRDGECGALDELIPYVYRELHQIAQGYLRRESPGHTLQPTALIHEAYLRLLRQTDPEFANRTQFFGVAARVMRQILVDHARTRGAAKRGANQKVPLFDVADPVNERQVDIIALDEALDRLGRVDPRKAKQVEMRFFGGMEAEEIAQCMLLPVHTVRRDLRLARAWLYKEMRV